MARVLVSWIGSNDLSGQRSGTGSVMRILKSESFQSVHLLHNQDELEVLEFLDNLRSVVSTPITPHKAELESPTDYPVIYEVLVDLLESVVGEKSGIDLVINLSSGTSAMASVSVLVGKTIFPATFLQTSEAHGVSQVNIPFDIAADFIPDVSRALDKKLNDLVANDAPAMAAFHNIITQDPKMQELKQRGAILASREVPVLICGESGTGKELFARAIHNASERSGKPFIPLNCGAIPSELIDSTLFGHIKGAFSGAVSTRAGVFEQVHGGTLFLDEFGELPLDAQVRLLRVLQDGTFFPVGSEKEKQVDVRLVAATNQDLPKAVAEGRFREDLFYRVAVGVLNLPPLREREGDRWLLADTLMKQINDEASAQPGYKHKKISAGAKNLILSHPWPGNVRELHATLLRASLWSGEAQISEQMLKESMIHISPEGDSIMDRDISQGIDIQRLLGEVEEHYIHKALLLSGGVKKDASRLLGYKNYQNLDARLKKYGIEK